MDDSDRDFFWSIDFDYWCNAKRDIVLLLHERGSINGISELSRIIRLSFSVTYRHLNSLEKKGFVRRVSKGGLVVISLRKKFCKEFFSG